MSGKLGIVAGAGPLPGAVAAAASRRGMPVILLPLRGFADRPSPGIESQAINLFDPVGALAEMRRHGVVSVMLAGSVQKPGFSALAAGWQAMVNRDEIRRIVEGGDDNVLRGVVRFLETNGFVVVGVGDVAPELLGGEGLLTGRGPTPEALADIDRGRALLSALGPFDVGQAAVLAGRRVLAVEGAEGTDAMLRRVALLRRAGPIGRLLRRGRAPVAETEGGVLVKVPKAGQDRRVDLPTIGERTIRLAAAAGLAGIAFEAGGVLVLDQEAAIAAAERLGIFVIGIAP